MTCELTRKLQTRLFKGFQSLLTTTTLLLMRLGIWLPDANQARAEAFKWLMTLHPGTDLEPHLPEFRRWLDARPENRPEFTALWEFWQQLDGALEASREEQPDPEPRPVRPWWDILTAGRALAATAIVALLVGGGLYLSHSPQLLCNQAIGRYVPGCSLSDGQHSTQLSEVRRLALIDGSSIQLSENSAVTLDFAAHHRRVRLDRGGARFQVVEDPRSPFEVRVDGSTVRALGTSFFIKKTGVDSARIEVTEGSIELKVADEQPVQVSAGQVAEFEPQLIRLSTTESSSATGIRLPAGTLLIFRGKSLGDAAREFNRYNPKQPILVDARATHYGIDGPFAAAQPREFAEAVAATWGTRWDVLRDATTGIETIWIGPPGSSRHPPQSMRGHQSVEKQP